MLRQRLRLRVTTGRSTSFAVNAEPGGVCIQQMRVLPVGARVEGSIWLDGGDLPFVGHVAWAAAGEHRLNQSGRIWAFVSNRLPRASARAWTGTRHGLPSGRPPLDPNPGKESLMTRN